MRHGAVRKACARLRECTGSLNVNDSSTGASLSVPSPSSSQLQHMNRADLSLFWKHGRGRQLTLQLQLQATDVSPPSPEGITPIPAAPALVLVRIASNHILCTTSSACLTACKTHVQRNTGVGHVAAHGTDVDTRVRNSIQRYKLLVPARQERNGGGREIEFESGL